jgi:tetratricopeptide (TPR) repeat protein
MSKGDLIFISYASEDTDEVYKIYEGLKKRGLAVWFDKRDLRPGKWKEQIEKTIPKCRYFIFCLSNSALEKISMDNPGFIEDELQIAWNIARDQDEKKFTIIPVRLEDCYRGDHRINIYEQYDLFLDFDKVLDKLALDLGGHSLTDPDAKIERTKDEKIIDSLRGLAGAFFYSGEYEKSLSHYNNIIKIKPNNYEAWNNKGLVLCELGRYDEAIKALDKAVEINPDNYGLRNNQGLILFELGKYDEAIKAFDKAIEINPDNHEVWNNKGLVLCELGRYNEAIKAYDKAIEINPDSYEVWNNKGIVLGKLEKYVKSIKAFDRAIQINPDYHMALNNKEIIFNYLEKVIDKLPD